jgi:hypothetical protein
MKLLRTPSHEQLLKMLTTARQRSELTLPRLADQVSASREFVAKYQRGELLLDVRLVAGARHGLQP